MAITEVSKGQVEDPGATCEITLPATPILANDIILVVVAHGNDAACSCTTGGYAEVCDDLPTTSNEDLTTLAVWLRASGGEESTAVAFDVGGNDPNTLACLVLRGVDASTAIDTAVVHGTHHTSDSPGADEIVDFPAFTTTTDDAMLIAISAVREDGAISDMSSDSGDAEWAKNVPDAPNDVGLFATREIIASAGPTGADQHTYTDVVASQEEVHALIFALRPAAGGAVHSGACSMTGAGVVTVAETMVKPGVVAMTGAGAVTAIAGMIKPGVVAMTGTGVVTVAGVIVGVTREGVCSMTGTGVLTSAAAIYMSGVCSMTGSGVLTSAALVYMSGVVSMTGGGTLTVVSSAIRPGVCAMTATGVLTADGTIVGAALEGVCAMTGAGTLTVASSAIRPGASSMTGSGSVTAIASMIKPGVVAMTGAGTLTVTSIAIKPGVVSMTGSGSLTVASAAIRPGVCSLTGTGILTAVVGMIKPAVVAMTGTGVLTVSGVVPSTATYAILTDFSISTATLSGVSVSIAQLANVSVDYAELTSVSVEI